MRDYDEWADSLRLVGDEAFLPSERVPRPYRRLTDEERVHYKRDWERRRRASDPDYYARHLAANTEYKRRRRAKARAEAVRTGQAIVTYASLHGLACTGPTRATGCRCRAKVMLYRRAG